MPKLTLFDAQTVGVDMKTNPLFVGAKRLHAATNLVFSEGVVKTRPGFSYNLTRAMGCFQGAAEFFPKKGLSVESFSEVEGGIAVVAGGKLYFNCAEVLGMVLPSTGDVNLYQAENYLIIQHADAATYWWDGVNAPVKSIGMNEQDWEDPSTDFVEVEVVPPVSNIPECENFDYTNIVVDFLVIDHITEEIIPLPGYTIKLKNNRVAYGTGTAGGRFNFKASKKTYTYTVEKEGYVSVVDKSLKVTESKSVVVRLEQAEELVCSKVLSNIVATDTAPSIYTGQFTLQNTGSVGVTILSISGSVGLLSVSPPLPATIAPGVSQIVTIHADTSLSEVTMGVQTTCGTTTETTTEIVFPPSIVIGCEQCTPSTLQIYASLFSDNGVDPPVGPLYGDAVISLVATDTNEEYPGECVVIAPLVIDPEDANITVQLMWRSGSGEWDIDGIMAASSPTSRCDPSGAYYEFPGAFTSITLSTTPLL